MKIHFPNGVCPRFSTRSRLKQLLSCNQLQPNKIPTKNPMKYERSRVAQSYVSIEAKIRSGCV